MNEALQLTHTRIDDIPLLLSLLMKLGIPDLYDKHVGDHGLHTGLSGGWMITIWMVFILTQSDHTKYKVEEWVRRHSQLLTDLTGQQIDSSNFNDNRLARLLTRLSLPKHWERFEAALWQNSLAVYEILSPSVGDLLSAHVDSTSVSGYHQPHPNGVMQYGYSKDHRPDLAQLKLMTLALHPHGLMIASEVVSGNRADDSLYLPLIARTRQMLSLTGLLYVGDSKMAAMATRAQIARQGDYYLTVAPATGETAQKLPAWIEAAVNGSEPLTPIFKENGEQIGRGYQFYRECHAEIDIDARTEGFTFYERVQVIQSDSLALSQANSLEKRLEKAIEEIARLTPAPGRGRRQYRDEESLKAAVGAILKKQKVEGLLEVDWQVEENREVRLVGRGRGGANRERRDFVTRRCQIESIVRDEQAIAAAKQRLGWRVQLSNAPEEVSLERLVIHYRSNWRGERNYNRLKSEPIGIDPIFVRRDDQITGLTQLLTLCARIESLIELQVERGLKSEGKQIKGLYAGLPNKATDHPTTVAMLKAIERKEITLTRVEYNGEESLHLTELPEWLEDVLRYLHLSPALYADLRNNSAFDISIFGK